MPKAKTSPTAEAVSTLATAPQVTSKTPRPNTKFAGVYDLLSRPEGATIAQMQTLTGWQVHSIRGLLAGTFKKRFAVVIHSEKTEAGRVYRLAQAAEA